MTYVAPETEQMTVRFEQNIMSDVQQATMRFDDTAWGSED